MNAEEALNWIRENPQGCVEVTLKGVVLYFREGQYHAFHTAPGWTYEKWEKQIFGWCSESTRGWEHTGYDSLPKGDYTAIEKPVYLIRERGSLDQG